MHTLEKTKTVLLLPEIETKFITVLVHSPVTITTEPPLHHIVFKEGISTTNSPLFLLKFGGSRVVVNVSHKASRLLW